MLSGFVVTPPRLSSFRKQRLLLSKMRMYPLSVLLFHSVFSLVSSPLRLQQSCVPTRSPASFGQPNCLLSSELSLDFSGSRSRKGLVRTYSCDSHISAAWLVALTEADIKNWVPVQAGDRVGAMIQHELCEIIIEPTSVDAVRMHLAMYAMLSANPNLLQFRHSPMRYAPLVIAVAARFELVRIASYHVLWSQDAAAM